MKSAKDLLLAWFGALTMRRALLEQRTVLGIEHAKFGREVEALEVELMTRFPGTEHLLPDGRMLSIGKPGCRLAERMKITGVSTQEPTVIVQLPSWEDCEKRCDEGVATPIERFIYDNEPGGYSDRQEWRQGLALALGFAHTNFLR